MRGLVLLLALGAALLALPGRASDTHGLPGIVFVSRQPIHGEAHAVPGLGPHQRAVVTGGRLLVREPDGRVRRLAEELYDVSDPAVAWDGRSVAFAGVAAEDSAWRIYVVPLAGGRAQPVTHTEPGLGWPRPGGKTRYDDLDPCWIAASELCFASTRYPIRAQYADVPATNLFVTRRETQGWREPERITSERNGGEEPVYDFARDRVVFSRWWFNRWRPGASGPTTEAAGAISPDSVNLWQAISIPAHGGTSRLAAGQPDSRRGMMAYQAALLPDGDLAAVFALNLGLWPRPGSLGIQRLSRKSGRTERLAGADIPERAPSGYSDALGLAAPGACSPAALPDGRVLFSYDPGGRGDYGLYVIDGRARHEPRRVIDLPGTLELDAAPIIVRAARAPQSLRTAPLALTSAPPLALDSLTARGTFTYHSLGLFSGHGAPRPVDGARIRFYAAPLLDPLGTRDTLILLREARVRADGSVVESGLPADVPLFEQVVDANGRVLRAAHGAAHVAGFNAGRPGTESRCVGCHVGHSKKEP
jgi:hypothetical protein